MKMGRQTGSGRGAAFAAAGLCVALLACQQPVVGERVTGPAPSEGPSIVIDEAWIDLHGHVVATFTVTNDEVPLGVDDVTALEPRFTLATLSAHPVDGIPSWKSQLLTGPQVAARVPPGGPGTPDPDVLTSVRQPGFETPTSLIDLGGGRFRYVFAIALSDFDPDETIRVGAWLDGAPAASLGTSATHDFRPSGGPVDERETVLDRSCAECHRLVARHGPRTHVRLCLTCHTWQHSDPDTIDPASLATVATTDPNPLELGRLVHRLHRGKRLPTLFRSPSQTVPAPALGAGSDLPLPFSPQNWTTVVVGRKYSVVGQEGEVVFGRAVMRMDVQQLTTIAQTTGNLFPRDYRDCEVCHADAPQAHVVTSGISRRLCAGCHPEIWFGTTPITDLSHVAHPGGPRADDSECFGCHVDPAGTSAPKLYAPIALAHVPPPESARANTPRIELLRIEGFVPGGKPTIRFSARDRVGPIGPTLGAPVPAYDPDPVASSYIPRRLSLTINLAGQYTTDGLGAPEFLNRISSGSATNTSRGPDPLTITTVAADEYVYAFTTTLPLTVTGTWAVAIEASRNVSRRPHYDKTTDTFAWPYTGETVREVAKTNLVYVDSATGVWTPEGPPAPAPRRTVVSTEKCLRCHGRFEIHGGARNLVQYCLFCHTPVLTDYSRRPKLAGTGSVNLGATYDSVEERSFQLKVFLHRIHTGRRQGGASLEGIQPVFYARTTFREGLFPGDLANCTNCHEGKSYLVENVPAGAMPNYSNETGVLRHTTSAHPPDEQPTPPITAACLGCHAAGPTIAHAASYLSEGVERCGPCHEKGPYSTEVVHGLARPTGGAVASTFSSIVEQVLVPRCATSACHAAGAAPPVLDAGSAYAALVSVQSGQASLPLVEPNEPEASYLVHKLRGTQGSVGGSGAIMPTDGVLAPADLAAIEAWIANGALNE